MPDAKDRTETVEVVSRPNLVVVRAGDNSLHRAWATNVSAEDRSWDLCVSYFGSSPIHDTRNCEILHFRKGNKWDPIHELYTAGLFDRYEYVWMPDDDLYAEGPTINMLFAVAKLARIQLAQPALTPDSFIAHPIVQQNPDCLLRFTTFVELMAPLFSRDALRKCAATFAGNKSAWGVDFAWTSILGRPSNGIAIIDAAPVRHTRPIGATYNLAAAFAEMDSNLAKYQASREMEELARVPMDTLMRHLEEKAKAA